MAFTRDILTSFPIESYKSQKGENKSRIVSYKITFTSSNSLAQNEIMRITQLPTGTGIVSGMVRIVTANTGVTDIDIGYGTGLTASSNIADGLSMATAGFLAINNITKSNGAAYMTATNNVSITNKDATTLSSGALEVILEIVDYTGATT